jgi:hypothetical protein
LAVRLNLTRVLEQADPCDPRKDVGVPSSFPLANEHFLRVQREQEIRDLDGVPEVKFADEVPSTKDFSRLFLSRFLLMEIDL